MRSVLLVLLLLSINRGELSFLQPVHFCICWRDSAVLSGYLFRQWPACVRVPNWKNVLGVSAVVRCVCMVSSATYTVADIDLPRYSLGVVS